MISIIMPVFNAKRYLARSVSSILNQTMTDWELIIVNDGSTDSSSDILETYSKQDSRIHVIQQPNRGVAFARQVGIACAKGEYSIHCDADDWIEPTMLEDMYNESKKERAEIVISDFYYDEGKSRVSYTKMNPSGVHSSQVLNDVLSQRVFGSLWHKLIKHSLYKEYNASFVKGINYCEDVLVLAQLLKNPLKVTFLHKAYYHYCIGNKDSITRNYSEKTYLMRQKYIKELKRLLPEKEYHHAVDCATLLVKYEAVKNGLIKWSDINNCPDYMKTTFSAAFVDCFARRIQFKYLYGYFYCLIKS